MNKLPASCFLPLTRKKGSALNHPVRALYTVIRSGQDRAPSAVLSLLINAKHPWEWYSKNGHMCFVYPDLESAINASASSYAASDEWLYRAARTIRFTDSTGLRLEESIPPTHRIIVPSLPADHGIALSDRDGTPFMLHQPYGNPAEHVAELNQLGVSYIVLPREIAPYNGGDRRDPASTSYLYTSPIFEKRFREIEQKLKAVNLQIPPWNSDTPTKIEWEDALELVDRARRTA